MGEAVTSTSHTGPAMKQDCVSGDPQLVNDAPESASISTV